MTLEYVPLLQVQRDLYALPRGRERFDAYIDAMRSPETGGLALPLVAMNPMGKEHVPALLDEYIANGTEDVVAQAVRAVASRVSHIEGSFRVCLVIADDLKGGWTNRYTYEFDNHFVPRRPSFGNWLVGLLWTSEPANAGVAARVAAQAVYRAAWASMHGRAATLADKLAQEGYAMGMAGCEGPTLEDDDLAYTREVIAPHRAATDRATTFACVFGDTAARTLGYPPQGLSDRAGLALALHEFRAPGSQ